MDVISKSNKMIGKGIGYPMYVSLCRAHNPSIIMIESYTQTKSSFNRFFKFFERCSAPAYFASRRNLTYSNSYPSSFMSPSKKSYMWMPLSVL